MVHKYKNVMDYLTDHTGKLTNTTEAVTYLYNLLQEEVYDYIDYVCVCMYVCLNFHRITIFRLRKIWRYQDGLKMFSRVRWKKY